MEIDPTSSTLPSDVSQTELTTTSNLNSDTKFSTIPSSSLLLKKKLFKTGLFLVIGVLVFAAWREFVMKNNRWQQILNLPRSESTYIEKSELEKAVQKSKESQAAIAQLKTTCESKNTSESCVLFTLNTTSLECESRPQIPCCGNNVCEQSEPRVCFQDCQLRIGQTDWDTLISVRGDTDTNIAISLRQSFASSSVPLLVTQVNLGVSLAAGTDLLRLQIFPEGSDTENPIWEFLLPLSDIPISQIVSIPVIETVQLLPDSRYILDLSLAHNQGALTLQMNSLDGYPHGTLQSVTEHNSVESVEMITGDLVFEIVTDKPLDNVLN